MAHPVFGIKLDNDSIDLRLSRERAIMLNELARSLRARKGKHNKLGKAEDRLLNEIEQAFEYLLTEQSDADYPTILQHARERIERPRKDDALLEGDMLNFDADITFLTTEEGGRGKLNGKDYPLGSGGWTHIKLSCGIYGCKVYSLDDCPVFTQGECFRANLAFYCVKHECAPEIKEGLQITLQDVSHVVGHGIITKINS